MATKKQQKLTVAEGIAVGAVALGIDSLAYSKMRFEFAVESAWYRWDYASHFPSLLGQHGGNEIWLAVGDSGNSRRMNRWEIEGGRMYPVTFDDWSPEDCWDVSLKEYGVPLHGWVDLTKMIHDHMAERSET